MYRFADLTHEQKLERRELLDWYGFIAQISVLAPLLAIQCYNIAQWAQSRLSRKDDLGPPSSPYAKSSRLGHNLNVPRFATRWRQFVWWCGASSECAGLYVGTRGQVLGAVVWMLWLLLLSFLQTRDDYLHLTKRFGTIGASQLPFHYLLSLKSPYSPLQLLTRRSHESLIAYHQLLGRIITILLYIHVVLYLNFYIQMNLLLEKITQLYIICGIFGILAFTAIGTTALKPLRDWSYRIFYIIHVVLAILVLPVLYFHVHHIRVFIYETLCIYALHATLRFLATQTHTGTIKLLGSDLIELQIPVSGKKANAFHPGQHAYLSLAGHPLLRTFKSNPFTVASIPPIDGHIRFIARILDGNTAKLASSTTKASQQLTVEGPYGLASHAESLLSFDRVLFVAGGVGATFIVPLYRQLLSDLSPGKGSQRRQRVTFLWVARALQDVEWALPQENKDKEGFAERLRVYLSRDTANAAPGSDSDGIRATIDDDRKPTAEGEEGIELEERKNLLSASGHEGTTEHGDRLGVTAGRPDLSRAVEQVFTHGSTERVAVIVCGPRRLSNALRKEVGRFVRRGRDVWFWDEHFST